MNEVSNWYENVTYEDAKKYIQSNVKSMARSFIAVGYYLKHIRDKEMYKEDGYKSIWEFAENTYGLQRTTTQRWMAINDRFSKAGNSPVLDERYQEFGKSQLQEMLYLTDDQVAGVTPDMTVKEIRQVGKPEQPEPAQEAPELEPLSALGLPKTVRPEGSLITEPGCGSGAYDCFSCHRDGCGIRSEACYCVEAPMGNPFPCTVLGQTEMLREEVGNICQFVDLDLAETRAGDGEPVPCCQQYSNPCGYECGRSTAKRKVEKQEAEGNIDDLNFSVQTRKALKTAGISTVEQLKAIDRNQLVILRGMGARSLREIDKALEEYPETDRETECATSHTEEDEQLPGQMNVQDYPEMAPEPEIVKDEAWFVKEYFDRYDSRDLPELMRICRENKSNSDRAKAAQKLIAPYGCKGGWTKDFGYDFHGFTGGINFEADGSKLHMKYGRFIAEMLKLYDPWDPQWLPADEPEVSPDPVETVSGEVEDAAPEKAATTADEPRFTALFIRDILWDKEQELQQMEECNAQPDGRLPERMMQEHRAVVAGLRLLLELTEMQEKEEADE